MEDTQTTASLGGGGHSVYKAYQADSRQALALFFLDFRSREECFRRRLTIGSFACDRRGVARDGTESL